MISSRTPEGDPNHCPVCGNRLVIEPSTVPLRDAPCPSCGVLLQFLQIASSSDISIEFNEKNLFKLVDQIENLDAKRIVVDCRGVDFMSSAVLGNLVTLSRKAKEKKLLLVLKNLSHSVREFLEVTKLTSVLNVE